MTPAAITIVTVCHNSMAVLPVMLDSIPLGVAVILVDNASQDTDALQALADAQGARLILNTDNAGFGVACNQGAAQAQTEFLLFLNPDAALQSGALDAFLASVQAHPEASAFNPRISDGQGRQSFRRGSKIIPKERFKVVHLSGHGSPRSPQVAAFKSYYSARSRVYTLGKYGHPRPKLSTLWAALLRVLGPDTLFSKRRRAKNVGYFKGALSALKDGGRHG